MLWGHALVWAARLGVHGARARGQHAHVVVALAASGGVAVAAATDIPGAAAKVSGAPGGRQTAGGPRRVVPAADSSRQRFGPTQLVECRDQSKPQPRALALAVRIDIGGQNHSGGRGTHGEAAVRRGPGPGVREPRRE